MDASALQALFRSVADYAAQRRSGDADRIHRPLVSYADAFEGFLGGRIQNVVAPDGT